MKKLPIEQIAHDLTLKLIDTAESEEIQTHDKIVNFYRDNYQEVYHYLSQLEDGNTLKKWFGI